MDYRDTKNLLDYAASVNPEKRKLLANTIRDILAEERPDLTVKAHMVGKTPTANASFESAASAASKVGGSLSPITARAIDSAIGADLGLPSGMYSQMVSSGLQNLRNLRDRTSEIDRVRGVLSAIREPSTPPNVTLQESLGTKVGYPGYQSQEYRAVPTESALTRYEAPQPRTFTDMRTGAIVPVERVEVMDITPQPALVERREVRALPPARSPFDHDNAVLGALDDIVAQSAAKSAVKTAVMDEVTRDIENKMHLSEPLFQRALASSSGYTDTSPKPFSGLELDSALEKSRVAAQLAGRAPIDMAGAFNRYGSLPAPQFTDKIKALAAIENPQDVAPVRDVISQQMDRQLAAERGRFNAPVRGETVADKVRFLNQINNSVPESIPVKQPASTVPEYLVRDRIRSPISEVVSATPATPATSSSLAIRNPVTASSNYPSTPIGEHKFFGRGTGKVATIAALATPFLVGAVTDLIARKTYGDQYQ